MSRMMILTGMFGLGLAVASGCGSKSQPEQPTAALNPEPAPLPTPGLKGEPAKVIHEMDPARHGFPAGPVRGTVGGAAFVPEVQIDGDYLILRTMKTDLPEPDREVSLKLGGNGPKPFENRKVTVRPDTPEGSETPEVLIRVPSQPVRLFPNGYALTLELGSRQAGKLPGKIYLSLPDEEKTVLAGIFEATYHRQPTEPPGAEDVPFVSGSITVRGAAPNATLRAGYVGNPTPDLYAFGSADTLLFESATPLRWTRSDHDKPRVTTLVAGDGKNVPSRYEHSKLTPGRYLVFAMLQPAEAGAAVSKWVTVLPNSTLTVELMLDATQTGGVEITVPLEALGRVWLVPTDEPGTPPLSMEAFVVFALQLGLERNIIARKALFRNLVPGKYEVRAAGQSRVVEVVAGRTAELDFEPRPIPVKPEIAPEPRPKG